MPIRRHLHADSRLHCIGHAAGQRSRSFVATMDGVSGMEPARAEIATGRILLGVKENIGDIEVLTTLCRLSMDIPAARRFFSAMTTRAKAKSISHPDPQFSSGASTRAGSASTTIMRVSPRYNYGRCMEYIKNTLGPIYS